MVGWLAGVMLQTEHQRGVHGAMGHREQCRSGPGLLIQVGLQHIQLRWRQPIGTAEQNEIRGLKLITEQLIDRCDVIEAGIIPSLLLQCLPIRNGAASGQSFTVHQRHHTVHVHTAANGRPVQGLQQRTRQRQTTGLHHDSIQLIRPLQQLFHRRQEVVLHRAAQAAVVELHKTAVQLIVGAETATANQIPIQSDTAEFIDHHGQTLTTAGEQMAQNGGFTGTEETGDHGDRQTSAHGTQGRQPRLSRVDTPLTGCSPVAVAQSSFC